MQHAPVGRFAPSPSGRMHLGNAFSCLLSWLSVRSQNGRIILRQEDLDPARCRRSFADQVEEDLLWLGLDWDEGGSRGGDLYYQSHRRDIYESYLNKLEEDGLLYPCFCSRGELHAASAPHASDGTLLYAGTCRDLTPQQRLERSALRRPALRIRVPDETITVQDAIQGTLTQNLQADCGDFIVRRADGAWAYQLAVVVDDALMGVTEVVRGRDLLLSSAQQIYLYELLGFPVPRFCHLPLLVNEAGQRLSKRDKSLDMGCLRERYTPEQLLGILAHAAGQISRPDPISLQELLPIFSWDHVPTDDVLVRL